jgi:hypothetical protein
MPPLYHAGGKAQGDSTLSIGALKPFSQDAQKSNIAKIFQKPRGIPWFLDF